MKTHRFHNKLSIVDDSLFGDPVHIQQRNKILEKKWSNNSNTNGITEINSILYPNDECSEKIIPNKIINSNDYKIFCPTKEENVRILTQDMFRNIRVPKEKIKTKSLLLKPNEFSRLKAKANILTEEELKNLEELEKQNKDKQMMDSLERRTFMQNMDLKRHRNEKLSDLEEEAYRKSQYLLEKAMQQREEQEPEIKLMNNLAKNAEIQAIRDAQILEKEQIAKELREEEKRLDQMMEIERLNQIKIQEEIDLKKFNENKYGAYEIVKQIEANEEEKLLELEMKDRENKHQQQLFIKMMEAEYARKIADETRKALWRKDMDMANRAVQLRKQYDVKRDIMVTQKVLAIQKQKAEREEAYDQEQRRIRKEKELETARLRALQEKFQDEKAERDELKARRAVEDAEREYRRKEKADQLKKEETEKILKASRVEQMMYKAKQVALQATIDKSDFDRMVKLQLEAIEKEKIEHEKRFGKIAEYTDALKRQIRDKERQLIIERHEFFQEGVKVQEEARLRKLRLEAAKSRKFNELKKAGIPDIYLAQLNRKLESVEQSRTIE